jgi:integrase
MSEKFTESRIRALESRDKVYVVRDGDCPYLYVRVQPSGKKAFYYQFKLGGKQYRGNIGEAGQISIASAREIARENRTKMAAGEPLHRIEHKKAPTIADLLERYQKDHISRLKASTQDAYLRYSDWLRKEYGDWLLSAVDLNFAKRVVDRYSGGKKVTANRFLATARNAWNFAKMEGMVSENPFEFIRKFKEKPRDDRADEYELLKIIDSIESEENPITKAYHLTILYTMCRRGEADKMRWMDIDGNIWTKPRGSTKNSKPQRVFLIDEVMAAINDLPRGGESDLVFQNFQGFSRAWKRILNRAGLPYPGVRVHDLRRSVAVWLLTTNKASVQQISFMLGHSSVAITQKVYATYLGDNRRAALAIQSIKK